MAGWMCAARVTEQLSKLETGGAYAANEGSESIDMGADSESLGTG